MLKHDEQGFLTGSPRAEHSFPSWDELRSIATDVRAIRLLLERYTRQGQRQPVVVDHVQFKGGASNGGSVRRASGANQATISPQPRQATRKLESAKPSQVVTVNTTINTPRTAITNNNTIRHQVVNVTSVARRDGAERAARGKQQTEANGNTPALPKQPDKTVLATPAHRSSRTVTDKTRVPSSQVVIPNPRGHNGNHPSRDENGRFTRGDDPSVFSKITEAISRNDIDPSITAAKETARAVSVVATPLITGGKWLFSRKRDKENIRWLGKIWRSIRDASMTSAEWNRRQLRRLKAIEEKPVASSSDMGLFGLMLAALLGMSKVLTSLPTRLLAALAGVAGKLLPGMLAKYLPGGAAGRGGGAGTPTTRNKDTSPRQKGRIGRAIEWGGGLVRKGSEALSRQGQRFGGIKGVGAISALLGLAGAASIEMDGETSREEKNQQHGANVGRAATGTAGALAGAAIGTALLPGLGTVIGGLVGGYAADYFAGNAASELGSRFGSWITGLNAKDIPGAIRGQFTTWTNSLMASDIGTYLKSQWDAISSSVIVMWNKAVATFSEAWGRLSSWVDSNVTAPVSELLETSNTKVKEWTGVDVKETVSQSLTVASNAVDTVTDKAFSVVTGMMERAKSFAGNAIQATTSSLSTSANVVTDVVSKAATGRKSSVDGRWQTVKGDIVDAAKAVDVDAGTLAAIAHFESNGFKTNTRPIDTKNPSKNTKRQFDGTMAISTAHGLGQFLDGTWTDYINKYGSKYGIKEAGTLKKDSQGRYAKEAIATSSKYRNNQKIQAAMLAEFTRENVELGRKLGGKDELANVYALHNLGSGDGKKFLQALNESPSKRADEVLSKQVIAGNKSLYGNGGLSVAEAYARMGEKMREGDSYAQEARVLQYGTSKRGGGVSGYSGGTVAATGIPAPAYRSSSMVSTTPAVVSRSIPSVSLPAYQVPASSVSAEPPRRAATTTTTQSRSGAMQMPMPEPGRDVSDRRIAHIVTGGISGGL